MILASAFTIAMCYCASVNALDWRIAYGVHDFIVKEYNSHTLGGNVALAVSHETKSNVLLAGKFILFVDVDKDHLDSDHIGIRWDTNFLAKKKLLDLNNNNLLYGDVEALTRENTVSSIEREINLFSSIGYEFNTSGFLLGAKGGLGYYFLEIDDDAPKEQGFNRDGLKNTTLAYILAAESRIHLGSKFNIHVKGYYWTDGDQWLQNKVVASLSYDTSAWINKSLVALSAEYNQYNLDHYPKNINGNILDWDNDTLVSLRFDMPW